MKNRKHVQVYQDKAGKFRYRLVSKHGEILETPGQSYAFRQGARRAAKREHAYPVVSVF